MARVKQTARKPTTHFAHNNNTNNNSSLATRWNTIYSVHNNNNDPWSESNFGSMRRGGSSSGNDRLEQQESSHSLSDMNPHRQSVFSDINTTSNASKLVTPNITIQARPKQKQTKKKKKRKIQHKSKAIITSQSLSHPLRRHKKRGIYDSIYNDQDALKWNNILKEIVKYQESTHLLINRTAFCRLVREIAGEYKSELRFTKLALEAIQQSTEWYLCGMFKDANLCALHAHNLMIDVKDIQLARRLKLNLQYTF